MAHPLNSLIDMVLGRAEKRGDFDRLEGAGKPLPPVDDPKNAVMNRMMRESKVKPPVVVLKEEIAASRARLAELTDETERRAEMKVMADLQTRLAMEMEAFRRFG